MEDGFKEENMAFKFCPECGCKLDREYKFCPECGYKLLSENSSSQSFAKSINDNEELFSDVLNETLKDKLNQ